MKIYYMLIFLFLLLSCTENENVNENIEVYDSFSEIQKWLDKNNDKIKVLNFWATSCPPCLKEMPHFMELVHKYDDTALDVLLVSLDRAKDLNKRVIPFVKKHKITQEVVLLADDNYSSWTAKIDKSWYGALPATIIMKGNKRHFKFGAYTSFDSLEADYLSIK